MSQAAVIAIAPAALTHGPSCNGCARSVYSARHGQAWNKTPHSWCGELKRAIPIVLNAQDTWMRSEIPADCPVYAQRSLFS